jgi:hypothetical protein
MMGASSVGGVSLSGKLADGTALTGVPAVEVDAASVSCRSLKVTLKPTVDAAGASTANYLVEGATYVLTASGLPTPV